MNDTLSDVDASITPTDAHTPPIGIDSVKTNHLPSNQDNNKPLVAV